MISTNVHEVCVAAAEKVSKSARCVPVPASDTAWGKIVAPRCATAAPRSRGQYREAADRRLGMIPTDRREAVANRAMQAPPKDRPGYLLAAAGRASPRAAIKAFCLECVGWQRAEVSRCTAPTCLLWLYRPFRKEARDTGGNAKQGVTTILNVAQMP